MDRVCIYKRLSAFWLVALIVLSLAFQSSFGSAMADIEPPTVGGVQSGAQSAGRTVDGWLITKGSGVEASISVEHMGCAQCRWTVFRQCSDSSPGVPSPLGQRCIGPDVSCGPGQQRMFVLFAASPSAPLRQVDSYCFSDGLAEVVSAQKMVGDARTYAGQVRLVQPHVRSWPPDGVTLVNLPTYFAVSATPLASRDFGGQGYTMHLAVAASDYSWTFGDGNGLTTTDPGGGPPAGTVHHAYVEPGAVHVAVTVNYGATYSVVTPAGTIGPLPVDGGPVRTLPATLDLNVKEAMSGLTQ